MIDDLLDVVAKMLRSDVDLMQRVAGALRHHHRVMAFIVARILREFAVE